VHDGEILVIRIVEVARVARAVGVYQVMNGGRREGEGRDGRLGCQELRKGVTDLVISGSL
jgi:hypothetical protein